MSCRVGGAGGLAEALAAADPADDPLAMLRKPDLPTLLRKPDLRSTPSGTPCRCTRDGSQPSRRRAWTTS